MLNYIMHDIHPNLVGTFSLMAEYVWGKFQLGFALFYRPRTRPRLLRDHDFETNDTALKRLRLLTRILQHLHHPAD